MRFKQLASEDRRLEILQMLVGAPAYTSNERVLMAALPAVGHVVALDDLRSDLMFLAHKQLLQLNQQSALWVCTLTTAGLDVTRAVSRVPGVAMPSAPQS